jgi:ABC-2 type transport system ATP-binding protein
MYSIKTENLQFGYERQTIVHNLSLSVPKGSIYGFLGHNGAGKSTTIRLLLGLMQPNAGNIEIFGLPLKQNKQHIHAKIGALIESPSLYEHLSATDNLRVTTTYLDIPTSRIDEVLTLVGLEKEGKKKVKAFSTGMKQRLGLALALLNDPELLILDEPTNGLDPQGIAELRGVIQRLNTEWGKTIFLSSHILSEIEMICSHVCIIKKGKKLFEGTIDALKAANTEGVSVQLETNNFNKTKDILSQMNISYAINSTPNTAHLALQSKNQLPEIAAQLIKNDVGIYEMAIKNQKLEDLFLTLNEQEQ